jgi:hypothetical protein
MAVLRKRHVNPSIASSSRNDALPPTGLALAPIYL